MIMMRKRAGMSCMPNASRHSFSPVAYVRITEFTHDAMKIPIVIIN
jgi:hypothetical protein